MPTLRDVACNVNPNASNVHAAYIPTVAAGDTIVIVASAFGANITAAPPGFALAHWIDSGTWGVWYKVADGSEVGSSPVFTLSGNGRLHWLTATVVAKGGVPFATGAILTGTSIDPPAITPPTGQDDYVVVVAALSRHGGVYPNSPPKLPPAGYSVVADVGWGVAAARSLNMSTTDPASFTGAGSSVTCYAITMAITDGRPNNALFFGGGI